MTSILLLRHADIDPPAGNPDPGLNAKGLARAEQLARMLASTRISSIFTSALRRTQETAAPLAARVGLALPLPIVPPDHEFVAALRAGRYGPIVVVVGHSNTIPVLLDALAGRPLGIVIGSFDDLFVASVPLDPTQLVRIKYGN